MTNCEKAIEILQRTHDGDDLAPQHLRLVELAVNDMVTEVGQAAFEQLYTQIAGNTYVQPWYHEIENLLKDHRGYVYWKGIQVDHYSFDKYEDAHEAALRIGRPLSHPGDGGRSCFNGAPSLVVRRTSLCCHVELIGGQQIQQFI